MKNERPFLPLAQGRPFNLSVNMADMLGFVTAQLVCRNPIAVKAILKELLEMEEASAIWEMAVEEDLFAPILVELSSP